MKHTLHYIMAVLGVMIFMPSTLFAGDDQAVTALRRVWNYKANTDTLLQRDSIGRNVYTLYHFNAKRRNPTLFLIPTMYSIARGEREYLGEAYRQMVFHDEGHYDVRRRLFFSTIPSNRKVMPTVEQFMVPSLYDMSLFQGQILSPFFYGNRYFYKYRVNMLSDFICEIRFRPRTFNTQLVRGWATADFNTGRILYVQFEGNYDMLKYKVVADMNTSHEPIAVPRTCRTDISFRFLGNHIDATFNTNYHSEAVLPDSIQDRNSRLLVKTLRREPLGDKLQRIYDRYDERHLKQQEDTVESNGKKRNTLRHFFWNVLGNNLVNSHSTTQGPLYMRMSPLLNPLYMSFSRSKGISYELDMNMAYSKSEKSSITLSPRLGYNFKMRQFFFNIPLRLTYNQQHNGYVELTFANGNRISSGALVEDIQRRMGTDFSVPEFKDTYMQLAHNTDAWPWLGFTVGVVYHRRSSMNPVLMRRLGLESKYMSFAPTLTLRLKPWQENGPILTANYERCLRNIMKSNLSYERYELDATYKRLLKSLRGITLRAGTGFYTRRSSEYFVDFTNFRDNNLPSRWDDEWSAQFQLLDSRWYNESDYYVRGHASFESPLLALAWVPLVGKIIEMERIYVSALSIAATRPYYELGYGFTNRYFSTGIFVNFLNTRYEGFGCKFTLELFRRW